MWLIDKIGMFTLEMLGFVIVSVVRRSPIFITLHLQQRTPERARHSKCHQQRSVVVFNMRNNLKKKHEKVTN
jgi:hypothetical protein